MVGVPGVGEYCIRMTAVDYAISTSGVL